MTDEAHPVNRPSRLQVMQFKALVSHQLITDEERSKALQWLDKGTATVGLLGEQINKMIHLIDDRSQQTREVARKAGQLQVLVSQMRDAQKNYFKTRDTSVLQESKRLEKEVDQLLKGETSNE